MAVFTFNWNNSAAIANSNATGVRISHRKKSVGGTWLTTSYSPANDMSVNTITATNSSLDINTIYEFKIETICSIGGPILSGSFEGIKFACITPVSFDIFEPEGGIGIIVQGTDINAVKFYLKKVSDGSVIFSQKVNKMPVYDGTTQGNIDVCVVQVPGNTQGTYMDGTQYQWYYEMFTTINGAEISSQSPIGFCIQNIWQFPAVMCIEPSITNTTTSSTIKIDVGNSPYYKAIVSLRDSNNNLLPGYPVTQIKESSGLDLNKIVVTATGLAPNTDYSWSYQLVSSFNNEDVVHKAICGLYTITTMEIFSITPQPTNQTKTTGQTATFTSGAIGGSGTINYQWQYTTSNNPTSNSDWTDFGLNTSNVLNISNVQLNQNELGVRLKATQNGTTIYSTLARLYVSQPTPDLVGGFAYSGTDPYINDTTAPNAVSSDTFPIGSNTTTEVDYTLPTVAQNQFIVFKIPSSVTNFANWTAGTFQTGQFPDGAFRAMFTVGAYDYYVSRTTFAFNTNDVFKLLQ